MKLSLEEMILEARRNIKTKQDFLHLLNLLQQDAHENSREWENDTPESYISAMMAWARDMDGYYRGQGIEIDTNQPSWQVFTDMLLAARVYE